MKIGQLSRETGKSVAALRYYEEAGLLAPPQRTESGYRDYEPGIVERVQFIAQAQECGFTLREIAAILSLYDEGRSPCEGVARSIGRKVSQLDKRIAQLKKRRATLAEAVRRWESDSLSDAPICSLLNTTSSRENKDNAQKS